VVGRDEGCRATEVQSLETSGQRTQLARLSPGQIKLTELTGEKIQTILSHAPGQRHSHAASGSFAARPSGTEDIYKIYAESFRGADHLQHILTEAQTIVGAALAAAGWQSKIGSNATAGRRP
jgi:phosphoglucomutase